MSGHTSPVEYVKFNSGEDLVIAGSQSGTLKIWDPEAAKSKLKYNKVVLNSRKRGQILRPHLVRTRSPIVDHNLLPLAHMWQTPYVLAW